VIDGHGNIIGGHGRRLAALSLGLKEVPVIVRDNLTPEEVRAARLADNRVALSDIDTRLLQEELASLDFDLGGIFDDKELSFMSADLTELNDDAFIEDIEAELAEQAGISKQKLEEFNDKEVPIAKALGFKSVKTSDGRALAHFMARIEADSGLPAGEAFIQFIKGLVAP
jgi:hypothetical protein